MCWDRGHIPKQWKRAKNIFIPKPQKKLTIEILQPLSLISCVGKVLEYGGKLFLHTMISFRRTLSTKVKAAQALANSQMGSRILSTLDIIPPPLANAPQLP